MSSGRFPVFRMECIRKYSLSNRYYHVWLWWHWNMYSSKWSQTFPSGFLNLVFILVSFHQKSGPNMPLPLFLDLSHPLRLPLWFGSGIVIKMQRTLKLIKWYSLLLLFLHCLSVVVFFLLHFARWIEWRTKRSRKKNADLALFGFKNGGIRKSLRTRNGYSIHSEDITRLYTYIKLIIERPSSSAYRVEVPCGALDTNTQRNPLRVLAPIGDATLS